MRTILLLVTAVLVPAAQAVAEEPPALLDFESPEEVAGRGGVTRTLEVFATVTPMTGEVQGWSLSLTADGAQFTEATLGGISWNGRALTDRPFFNLEELAVHSRDPRRRGVVAALACVAYPGNGGFAPGITQKILKLGLEVRFPPDGETRTVTLRYENGFVGSGEPLDNQVYVEGYPVQPATASRTLLLRGGPTFRRGDANADARVDIGDAIFGFNFLFRGGPAPACERSLEANDDGVLNIADPVYLIGYILGGGPRPAEPFASCGLGAADATLTCSSHPPCA